VSIKILEHHTTSIFRVDDEGSKPPWNTCIPHHMVSYASGWQHKVQNSLYPITFGCWSKQ